MWKTTLAAVALVLGGLLMGAGCGTKTGTPATQAPVESAGVETAANPVKVELLPARQFNSTLKFKVSAYVRAEKGGFKTVIVGETPSPAPLSIPESRDWGVKPLAPVDMETLAKELAKEDVPGLTLGEATDAGLANLKGLTGLRTLNLRATQVTDAGVAYLAGLTGLRSLFLAETKITDAGLANLKDLSGLQNLDLHSTAITDAGLANLNGLTGLRFLMLDGTKVTMEGVAKLLKALPNCTVQQKTRGK
ncbi:MAG: hypothetical protein ABSE73_17245 [Planctomycetota bacterium]